MNSISVSLVLTFFSKSFLLFIISIVSIFLLMFMEGSLIIHFDLTSFLELPMDLTLILDKYSLIFISTVSMVSSIIVMYSFYYLENETSYALKKFLLTLLIFILSMLILSVSANIFWLMVGWDGLGISSFCLIVFYQNWKSFGSGMVTFLSNRLGDTLIILAMLMVIVDGSPDSWIFPSTLVIAPFLFSIGAFSKSAQLPYLFWLPQAMAAPTPVSALVHSSTLVTAGIYVMCRFQPMNESFVLLFFLISSITVLMAGTSSLMEFDLKKVIALSTLCHISLMMMFSMLGEISLSLFHLMMHAFFKSLLFMIAGYLIHNSNNSQDVRFVKSSWTDLKVSLPFFVSVLSMMGFPLLSGFYSKEALLMKSSYDLPSLLMMISFLLNSFFSCAYSVRLASYIFFGSKKKMYVFSKDSFGPILLLGSILSSFMGGIMMTSIVQEENEVVQSSLVKFLLLIFSISGMITGSLVNSFSMNPKISSMMSELWKSNFLYKIFQKHFFLYSSILMWKTDEKGMAKFLLNSMNMKFLGISKMLGETFLKEPLLVIKTVHLLFMLLIWLI